MKAPGQCCADGATEPVFGDRSHINAVAAFLVSRSNVPIEETGSLAVELIELAIEVGQRPAARRRAGR